MVLALPGYYQKIRTKECVENSLKLKNTLHTVFHPHSISVPHRIDYLRNCPQWMGGEPHSLWYLHKPVKKFLHFPAGENTKPPHVPQVGGQPDGIFKLLVGCRRCDVVSVQWWRGDGAPGCLAQRLAGLAPGLCLLLCGAEAWGRSTRSQTTGATWPVRPALCLSPVLRALLLHFPVTVCMVGRQACSCGAPADLAFLALCREHLLSLQPC